MVYNKIKHDRTGRAKIGLETKECYKFGNLQNVIQGLAGLYQILIYYYYTTAELERKRVLTLVRFIHVESEFVDYSAVFKENGILRGKKVMRSSL